MAIRRLNLITLVFIIRTVTTIITLSTLTGANWDTISGHVSHLILFSLEIGAGGKIIAKDRIPRKELMVQVMMQQ
jgi:hypothetical protein